VDSPRRHHPIEAVRRYIALLRGVSPANCKMPQLRECFQTAGFEDVRTVLSSGNVAFSTHVATGSTLAVLERTAEQAMLTTLGRAFPTIVRPAEYLRALLASDPFTAFTPPPTAKCVITFLRRVEGRRIELPLERDGVRVLKQVGTEVFTMYEPGPKGPVFMTLLERTFGKDITTRTLATVEKCAAA
jgi:uncharacterized protein (DUF1697 family)